MQTIDWAALALDEDLALALLTALDDGVDVRWPARGGADAMQAQWDGTWEPGTVRTFGRGGVAAEALGAEAELQAWEDMPARGRTAEFGGMAVAARAADRVHVQQSAAGQVFSQEAGEGVGAVGAVDAQAISRCFERDARRYG